MWRPRRGDPLELCQQRVCFRCGSVPLRLDIKGTELPPANILIPLEWEYFVVYKKYTHFAIWQCKLHRATCRRFDTIPACDRRTDTRNYYNIYKNTFLLPVWDVRWHHLWQPSHSSPCCRQRTLHEQTTHKSISADHRELTGCHDAWPPFYSFCAANAVLCSILCT